MRFGQRRGGRVVGVMRGVWCTVLLVVVLLAATTVIAQQEQNCGGTLVNVLESVEHCGSCFFKCQVPENTGGTMKCTNGECAMNTVDLYLVNQQVFPEA
mmetsp:Transcript_8740/g.15865  ORF Transcript_8740/g.15865 Transcript_8740/m.15865 type:complete len:99 (+) Transcript_8740:207-503(+)